FWSHSSSVRLLLNSWVHSHQTSSGAELVAEWAIDFVASRMRSEAKRITRDAVFRSSATKIGPEYLRGFKTNKVCDVLQDYCGTSVRVLLAMAGLDQGSSSLKEAPISKQRVIMYCLVAILREHSRKNNLVQVVFSLYMYAAGLQRQGFSILSHLGILISYTMLPRKSAGDPQTGVQAPSGSVVAIKRRAPAIGPLKNLSVECMKEVKEMIKSKKAFGLVFDNINMVFKVAEQVIGRIDTQENGTCATVFELLGATPESLDHAVAKAAFLSAKPLELSNILHSPGERALHRRLMVHNILRIVVTHGGEYFAKFRPLLESTQPSSDHCIPVHQSRTYPLPAMDIEESSIDGVINVMDAIYEEIGVDPASPEFRGTNQLVGGDQKSLSNLRSAKKSRAGNDDLAFSFDNIVLVIGLFHALMTAVVAFMVAHFGNPTANIHNPASLAFHNSLIERKPVSLTSLPPFGTQRSLINVSLIARIIHCLTLVSDCSSIDAYTEALEGKVSPGNLEPAWNQLVADATSVFEWFTDIKQVQSLRTARRFAKGNKAGDMVYENAVLFIRDGLNIREVIEGVKQGDPGRIMLIFKVFALSFRASGRPQYASEMLTLIHYVEKVWPAPLRNLVLQNMLLNPTGKPNAFVPLDLHQEHGNFWIKVIYNAHGSNASWSWLSVIAPCVEALRGLAKELNKTLGSYLGNTHTSPDISRDVNKIIRSLEKHRVYTIVPGRTFEGHDEPTVDMESMGLASLMDGSTSGLNEYNKGFKSAQMAYLQPVVSATPARSSFQRDFPPATSSTQNQNLD
ncbi:hypothetical protein BDV93DRAFT_456821, partial [Ceratobasidium sp. AG-I]